MCGPFSYLSAMSKNLSYTLDATGTTDQLSTPLFSMRGLSAGPRLVVTCPEELARALAERLWGLPNLGRMRGSLVVRADTQDPVFDLPDLVVVLREMPETDAYYQVLARMADLGMITGRGVPLPKAA